MRASKNSLRSWLINNGYEDIALLIEEIMLEWKQNKNKQRRNWWEILAGDKKGNSRIIAGRKIPVLKVAQIRKGQQISENAICRNQEEAPPIYINPNNRWNKASNSN